MSAADLRFLCDRAAMNALRRVFPTSAGAPAGGAGLSIEKRDFDQALGAPGDSPPRPLARAV